MKLIYPNTADLEAVLAVAHRGSFRSAAAALSLSQPAVTARIQRVEAILGVRIFDRTTRRTTLTEAGRRLVPEAERTMASLHRIVKELNDESRLRKGRIAFGASPTVACTLIPPVMRLFMQRWPQVELCLSDDFGSCWDRLVSNEVDFAVRHAEGGDSQFSFQKLCDDELLVVLSAEHPLSCRTRIELRDLRHVAMVSGRADSLGWSLIKEAFARADVQYKPTFSAGIFSSLVAMARAGIGYTFMSSLLSTQVDLTGLKLLRVVDQKIERKLGILTVRGKSLQPASKAFLRLLRSRLNAHHISHGSS